MLWLGILIGIVVGMALLAGALFYALDGITG